MSQANKSKSHKSVSGKASAKGSEPSKSIGKLGDQSEIVFQDDASVANSKNSKKSKKSNPIPDLPADESMDFNAFIPEMDDDQRRKAYEQNATEHQTQTQTRKESHKSIKKGEKSVGGASVSTH